MQNSCAIWNILVSSPYAVPTLTRNFLMFIQFAAKRQVPWSTGPGRLAGAEAQESIWALWHKPRIAWRCYHWPILNQLQLSMFVLQPDNMNTACRRNKHNSGNKTCSLWCCNEESVLIVDDQLPDGKLGYVTINCKPLHLYIWRVSSASQVIILSWISLPCQQIRQYL